MDVFSWSMPFLAEKVTSMLYTLVKKGAEDDDDDEDADSKALQAMKRDTSNMTGKGNNLF